MKKNILFKITIIILSITIILDFFFNYKNFYYLEPFINIIYILSTMLLIYFNSINNSLKEKKHNLKYYFILYIILIIYLSFNRFWYYHDDMYNLIPFNTILNIRGNKQLLMTLIFNFFLYMPFSIILPNLNDKFKKIHNYLITIIFISICIKGIGYIFHISVLDIDDLILNCLGAIIAFIVIKNPKVNNLIKNILFNIKIKEKRKNYLYITIYILFILISSYKSIGGLVSIYNNYYRNFSHFTCYKKEKTYVATIGNYKYYSKCDYRDSYVIAGTTKMALKDYVKSGYYRDSDENKLYLIKEKIIDNIKLYKKENTIKKISNYNQMPNLYIVDIDYITLTKNGINYKIENEKENDIDFISLVKFKSYKEYDEFEYIYFLGNDFDIIGIYNIDKKINYQFIVDKDFVKNDDNILRLYEFTKN